MFESHSQGRKIMFYLMTHSTHFYLRLNDVGHMVLDHSDSERGRRKEGNVLFNDALNTFYLRLNDVGHMVTDHSDSERGNPLLPLYGLLFPISSNGSFICTIPQTGHHIPRHLLHQLERNHEWTLSRGATPPSFLRIKPLH